jgi:hypothetical protein
VSDERRQFQRLSLTEPLDAWFGDYAVRLIDVSATGALIECDESIPDDARALLRFWWRGNEVEITAETARAAGSRRGLEFVEDNGLLWQLIADSATELLLAMNANAAGNRDANIVGDQTFTAAMHRHTSGYVTWTLSADGWKSKPSLLPDQPADGFTISNAETEDQVEMLRRTYELGDTEARRLTRMLAEISVQTSPLSR